MNIVADYHMQSFVGLIYRIITNIRKSNWSKPYEVHRSACSKNMSRQTLIWHDIETAIA